MKRIDFISILLALAVILMAMTVSPGCTETKDLVKTSNALYLDIKTIVTDPEVAAGIPPETMARLASLERTYLEAANVLRDRPESTEPMEVLAYCADEILTLLTGMTVTGKYQSAISAVRISVKLLRNHVGAS